MVALSKNSFVHSIIVGMVTYIVNLRYIYLAHIAYKTDI